MNPYFNFCYAFLAIAAYVAAISSANYQCGIRKHSFVPLVHHGWKIEDGQWPWHLAIMHVSGNDTRYACAGTLIDRRYVLTVAHCVVDRQTSSPMATGDILLHLGTNDLEASANHVQVRDVGRIFVHPEYAKQRNDIAVLKTRLPVEFSDFVIPICLDMRVDKDWRDLEGQRGWITGWGKTENETLSSELRSASLPVVSYLECVQNDLSFFGRFLSPGVFCAGDRNGTSPGQGDAGAGMYFNDGDRWVLRGILSFAKMDSTRMRVDTSKYVVFTNVQRYLTWIQELMDGQSSRSTTTDDVTKRISEKECYRFTSIAEKRRNGMCSNSRHLHTVSLDDPSGDHKCNGVLVNENHVLTTCRCIRNDNVKTAPLSTVRITDYGTVNVSSFICHPAFDESTSHHDLAIVRLESAVQLSSNLIPACLASNWTENLYDTLLTTGFTRAKTDVKGGRQFFESDANRIVSTNECNRNLKILKNNHAIGTSQLCITNNDRLSAASNSDSGSEGAPLQSFNSRTCMFTVVGILSNGGTTDDGGSRDSSLDVFSRVAYSLDWIEQAAWGGSAI